MPFSGHVDGRPRWVIKELVQEAGKLLCVVTSARSGPDGLFCEVSATRCSRRSPVAGAWYRLGADRRSIGQGNIVLEPIRGVGEYNHLSVRAAAAIMLDRLRQAR